MASTTVVYMNVSITAFALDSVIVAVAIVDTVRNPHKLGSSCRRGDRDVICASACEGVIKLPR